MNPTLHELRLRFVNDKGLPPMPRPIPEPRPLGDAALSWSGRERCDKCRWYVEMFTAACPPARGKCTAMPQPVDKFPDHYCRLFSPLPSAVPEGKARWEV